MDGSENTVSRKRMSIDIVPSREALNNRDLSADEAMERAKQQVSELENAVQSFNFADFGNASIRLDPKLTAAVIAGDYSGIGGEKEIKITTGSVVNDVFEKGNLDLKIPVTPGNLDAVIGLIGKVATQGREYKNVDRGQDVSEAMYNQLQSGLLRIPTNSVNEGASR